MKYLIDSSKIIGRFWLEMRIIVLICSFSSLLEKMRVGSMFVPVARVEEINGLRQHLCLLSVVNVDKCLYGEYFICF